MKPHSCFIALLRCKVGSAERHRNNSDGKERTPASAIKIRRRFLFVFQAVATLVLALPPASHGMMHYYGSELGISQNGGGTVYYDAQSATGNPD